MKRVIIHKGLLCNNPIQHRKDEMHLMSKLSSYFTTKLASILIDWAPSLQRMVVYNNIHEGGWQMVQQLRPSITLWSDAKIL